jgi:hypothetical protein
MIRHRAVLVSEFDGQIKTPHGLESMGRVSYLNFERCYVEGTAVFSKRYLRLAHGMYS